MLARVKPSDVEGLLSDVDRFAVWCFEEQELHVIGGQETIDLKLSPQQSDVLTVSPLLTLPEVHDAAGLPATWAPVGLTQMLNGGGAVLDSYVDVCSKGVNKILDGIETLLELAQNGTSGRSASTWATDLDFAWLLSMEDETLNPGTMSAPVCGCPTPAALVCSVSIFGILGRRRRVRAHMECFACPGWLCFFRGMRRVMAVV